MKKLIDQFEKTHDVRCDMIVASSGKLTAQINSGAPYHVFVSADTKYPMDIFKKGKAVSRPKVYAYGRLVLWSCKDPRWSGLEALRAAEVKHIALANPRTAPYGAASLRVLQKAGIYGDLKARLVYGESIAQTNQFITSGSAEAGFTALSVVRSAPMKGRGHWQLVDSTLYTPIAQGAVLLKTRQAALQQAAKQFYDFLSGGEAKKILTADGYTY